MKLKNYLIAVDLDGTLIKANQKADIKSLRLLRKLAKTNYVIIATGRPLRGSIYYYNYLKLSTPIINYNGALVQIPKSNKYPKKMITIDRFELFKFIKDNQDQIITIFSENEDDIYLYKDYEYVKYYLHQKGGNLTIGPLEENLKDDPNGAIVFSKAGSIDHLTDYVDKHFGNHMFLRCWLNKEIVISELSNISTTKESSLNEIIDFYNIDKNKTIAIGDGHNDIEMLKNVKYGVAMGNSHPDLIKNSTYITKDINHHGVYYFLKNITKFIKK